MMDSVLNSGTAAGEREREIEPNLVELMEKRCAAVLPGRIIADLGAAHGAGLFTFEPRLHTLITEYMTAL